VRPRFIVDNGNVWGRPVATTELKDGSLLLSDDGGNVVFRISYAP
jgi:glucose/arabinose dehydrogenase